MTAEWTQQMVDQKLVTWAINEAAILPHEDLKKLAHELVWGTLTEDYMMRKHRSIANQAKLHFARMMRYKHGYHHLMQEDDRILVTFPRSGPDEAWDALFDQAATPKQPEHFAAGWLDSAFLAFRPDDTCPQPLFGDDEAAQKPKRSRTCPSDTQ
jgi:hypothetical protein